MTSKRRAVVLTAGAIGGAIVLSDVASAHDLAVTANCDGVHVNLTKYNNTHPNHITVTIDGKVVHSGNFGKSYETTHDFTDAFISHEWSVSVEAWDDPQGYKGFSKEFSGTVEACEEAPTTTTPVTDPPTTTPVTNPPVTTVPLPVCTEDMACWNCATMGNHVCGTTTTTVAVPVTTLPHTGPSDSSPVVFGAGITALFIGAVLVRRFGQRRA